MSKTKYDISKLHKQLLPTGRAFIAPEGSNLEKLLLAQGVDEAEAFNMALGLLNSIIPDNDLFTVEDSRTWEKTLGIAADEDDTLENRKLSIYRKMSFPRNVTGRQHKKWLEYQLQQAGFNVRVYEYADFKDDIKAIAHKLSILHGDNARHGQLTVPDYTGYVANFIEQDAEYSVTFTIETLKNMFYISGPDFGFLPVLSERLAEFRHIILQIKPLYTIALLRIAPTAVEWILDSGYWNNSGYWFNSSLWTEA